MSTIRVPVISQIVALGIKRGAGDMSPVVRKAAALATLKCYRLDPTTLPLLVDQIALLLGDRQYYVAGAAVMAFLELCPERIDLVHPHYKGLIKKLLDMDEWGQLATLRLVLVYARKCFPRRTRRIKKGEQQGKTVKKDFYDEDFDEKVAADESEEETVVLDPDLDLLLRSILPLLQSRNSAVIIAVARCFLYLGTPSHVFQAAGPLVSILRAAPDIQSLALSTILEVCRIHSTPFVPYTTRFLLRSSDEPSITNSKLTLQSILFPHVTPSLRSLILTDLAQHTSNSPDPALVRAAVLAIGRCAQSAPTAALRARCLQLLLTRLSSPDPTLVSASLDEIRLLIQRSPATHTKTIVRLAKHLDALTAPKARAAIVWLVGEFAASPDSANIAADVWRILLRDFASETVGVQSQILLLAAKVYLHHHRSNKLKDSAEIGEVEGDDRITKMLEYTFLLARYAQSYVLRDRARLLRALVLSGPSTDMGALLLLAEKPGPKTLDAVGEGKGFIGSASWIVGVSLKGTQEIPNWTDVEVGVNERRGAGESATTSVGTTGGSAADKLDAAAENFSEKKPWNGNTRTLDEWLDDGENEEEESEETTEEEETSEEETDSEEDEEDGDQRERLMK
jgi:AP-3 complex subunit beta